MTTSRVGTPSRSFMGLIFLGVTLGALWTAWVDRGYQARCTLYFPAANKLIFGKLCELLKTDGGQMANIVAEPSENQENLARLVFTSRSAQQAAHLSVPPTCDITNRGLHLAVWAATPEEAQQQLNSILQYFDSFVKDHPTSKAGSVRIVLNQELKNVSGELLKTEKALASGLNPRLRLLGDTALRSKPELLLEIWTRRSESEVTGRAILDTLQLLREGDRKDRDSYRDWLMNWKPSVEKSSIGPRFPNPVRPADLANQARLERTYGDLLIRYRSILLQESVVHTLQQLDSPQYEVLDAPYTEHTERRWLLHCSVGALLGFVLHLLLPKSLT